jgi:hypothetical protein
VDKRLIKILLGDTGNTGPERDKLGFIMIGVYVYQSFDSFFINTAYDA